MRFNTTVLHSKVARRIFGLFVFCALLPIMTLALVSFGQVTKQLKEQNHRRTQQATKSIGMDVLERLWLLTTEMKTVTHDLRGGSGAAANFKKTFPLVVLICLWVVILLSIIHIRKSLVPLEKLKEGTLRIAKREFDSRGTVSSGDEFQELAASFNAMSDRLRKQFSALTIIAEIDRAILGALDREKIIDTVLNQMGHVLPCETVAVSIVHQNDTSLLRTYTRNRDPKSERRMNTTRLKPEEAQSLQNNPNYLFIDANEYIHHYLEPLARDGLTSFVVFPILLKERLAGIISLGFLDSAPQSEAGHHFDPKVVEAFLEVMAQEEQHERSKTAHISPFCITNAQNEFEGLQRGF